MFMSMSKGRGTITIVTINNSVYTVSTAPFLRKALYIIGVIIHIHLYIHITFHVYFVIVCDI